MAENDDDNISLSSVQTTLPSYQQHNAHRRPNSPTASYRTLVPAAVIDELFARADSPPQDSHPRKEAQSDNYAAVSSRFVPVGSTSSARRSERVSHLARIIARLGNPESAIKEALKDCGSKGAEVASSQIASVLSDSAKARLVSELLLARGYACAALVGDIRLLELGYRLTAGSRRWTLVSFMR